MGVNPLINRLREAFSRQELMEHVSELSMMHRIQGSDGIEEAADYIYEALADLSSFNVEVRDYSYLASYGNLEPLIGWWVKDAELRMLKPHERLLHSFNDSRTLVVAHSPGGDVRAELLYVGPGDRSKYYRGVDVSGKAVLASGNAYLAYREACMRGASAILLFKNDIPEDAVPYIGLFLTPNDMEWAKAVALSISRKTANELIRHVKNGDKVIISAYVEAGFRDNPRAKVVTARLGDALNEVHLFAHYCHPGGTVNDNVSGAATLIEVAKALDRALRKSLIPPLKDYSMVLLWFPEYYGSQAYLGSRDVSNVVFGINLDMIGEDQGITGSVINFVRPPPSLFHPLESVVYYGLRDALSRTVSFSSPKRLVSYKFDVVPYEVGSDHDVYIHFGVPSVMINQWPDNYYHTDLDTIDKFDPSLAMHIGLAVASSVYSALIDGVDEHLLSSYVFEYLGHETSWIDRDIREFRFKYLCKALSTNIVKYCGMQLNRLLQCGEVDIRGGEGPKYAYRGPLGVIMLRNLIRVLDDADLDELDKLIKEGFMRTVIQSLIPLLLREPKTLNELKNYLAGELGVNLSEDVLKKSLDILIKAGFLIQL